MKIKIYNSGTMEFPFYQVKVDGVEYCATDSLYKAEKLKKLLELDQVLSKLSLYE